MGDSQFQPLLYNNVPTPDQNLPSSNLLSEDSSSDESCSENSIPQYIYEINHSTYQNMPFGDISKPNESIPPNIPSTITPIINFPLPPHIENNPNVKSTIYFPPPPQVDYSSIKQPTTIFPDPPHIKNSSDFQPFSKLPPPPIMDSKSSGLTSTIYPPANTFTGINPYIPQFPSYRTDLSTNPTNNTSILLRDYSSFPNPHDISTSVPQHENIPETNKISDDKFPDSQTSHLKKYYLNSDEESISHSSSTIKFVEKKLSLNIDLDEKTKIQDEESIKETAALSGPNTKKLNNPIKNPQISSAKVMPQQNVVEKKIPSNIEKTDNSENKKPLPQKIINEPETSRFQNSVEKNVISSSKVEGDGSEENKEESKKLEDLLWNNRIYTEKFLTKFKSFLIIKTFGEKICCRKETNLYRLKKLKFFYFEPNEEELIDFICSKYQKLSKDQVAKYSVVDLFMVCSLIEIYEVWVCIKSHQNIFDIVKGATSESIRILELSRVNDDNIPKIFFENLRKVIVRNIKLSGESFKEITAEELRKSLISSN